MLRLGLLWLSLAASPAVLAAPATSATVRDVVYGEVAGETLLLDAVVPSGAGPFPFLLLIHGGGWTGGDKAGDIAPLLSPLAAAGFTCVSINYRLAPQHRWPACRDDVLAAIRWMKAHAATFKGDGSRIALIGYSAGGHLASFAATVVDDSARSKACSTDRLSSRPIRAACCAPFPPSITCGPACRLFSFSTATPINPCLSSSRSPFSRNSAPSACGAISSASPVRRTACRTGNSFGPTTVTDSSLGCAKCFRLRPDRSAFAVRSMKSRFSRPLVAGLLAAFSFLAVGVHGAERITRWGQDVLKQKPAWYDSAAARAVADSVVQYQSLQGGWPKSTNLAVAPRTPDDIPPEGRGRANSFDNDATTLPMEFLARVVHATGDARYRASFLRGLDYIFAAQYPNGGWPQFFPLREDYYDRITYNDGAMIRVLIIGREVAAGRSPYAFVDAARRAQAAVAVQRGVDCILKTQVKHDGKLTAWCAQHDERTLAPAWARAYEPPSLSGGKFTRT